MKEQPAIKRTRLQAVYLTSTERDLVAEALRALYESLDTPVGRIAKFATSHTKDRIMAARELFLDKPEGERDERTAQ